MSNNTDWPGLDPTEVPNDIGLPNDMLVPKDILVGLLIFVGARARAPRLLRAEGTGSLHPTCAAGCTTLVCSGSVTLIGGGIKP